MIEAFLFSCILASSYTFTYVSKQFTKSFFIVPVAVILNLVMLYCVTKMRFVIKSMPDVFPNENRVVLHLLFFTAMTSTWIYYRVIDSRVHATHQEYFEDQT